MKNTTSRYALIAMCLLSLTGSLFAQSTSRHAAFDKLLNKYVQKGLVAYVPLRDEALPQLNSYLDAMAQLDIASLSRNEQLAAYINIYNATMLKAVCDRYVPGYSPSKDEFKVFKDPLVRLKSGTVSLNDLENKIIRPTFKDPRIHVALVCGAISCPPLIDSAYTAATLDRTLETNLKRWLTNDPTRNRINADRRTVYLSKIFEWYAEDFGGSANVLKYVDMHHPDRLKGYAVRYLEYDWTLNIQKMGMKKQ
ncbi:MAG: hypothetical protein CMJ19_02985 [Phycisphaeraceae bacterium]|nr:hypothetical protein [Phycisphaeraceae bacterium]